MLEIKGNAWDLLNNFDALCITTNGFIKRDGRAVMGRGIAKEATLRVQNIQYKLANVIRTTGNSVGIITEYNNKPLIAFPVKHNWWEEADIELIKRSCIALIELLDQHTSIKSILLPRPGCGNGKLDWNYVKPIISELLDNRVYVVSW